MERRREGESSRSYQSKDAKRHKSSNETVKQVWDNVWEMDIKNRINRLKQSFPDIKISDIEENVKVVSYKECDIH